jgi:hypothetical protein
MQSFEMRMWKGKLVIQWDDEPEEMFITRMNTNYRPLIPPMRSNSSREVRDR